MGITAHFDLDDTAIRSILADDLEEDLHVELRVLHPLQNVYKVTDVHLLFCSKFPLNSCLVLSQYLKHFSIRALHVEPP